MVVSCKLTPTPLAPVRDTVKKRVMKVADYDPNTGKPRVIEPSEQETIKAKKKGDPDTIRTTIYPTH